MRFAAALFVMFLLGCASPQPYATGHHDPELGSRKAGTPQRCIQAERGEEFRLADNDRHVLLYGSGKMIWVNHLQGLCGFSHDDQLIGDAWRGQYCSGELVRSLDASRAEGPSCMLGDFTPYERSQ